MRLIPIILFLLHCELMLSQNVPVDSLQGFNSDAASAQAALNGCSGSEQQVYVQIAKRNYINHKFQLITQAFTQKQYGGPLTVANAPCVEEDFEGLTLGSLVSSAWISEASNSSSATSVPCTTTQITYSLNNQQAILVSAPITDSYCNNVGPSPLGGMNILQLNRNNLNTRPSRIRQTFSVTATNA